MLDGLATIDELVGTTRYFEALKRIRALFPVEQAILAGLAGVPPRSHSRLPDSGEAT